MCLLIQYREPRCSSLALERKCLWANICLLKKPDLSEKPTRLFIPFHHSVFERWFYFKKNRNIWRPATFLCASLPCLLCSLTVWSQEIAKTDVEHKYVSRKARTIHCWTGEKSRHTQWRKARTTLSLSGLAMADSVFNTDVFNNWNSVKCYWDSFASLWWQTLVQQLPSFVAKVLLKTFPRRLQGFWQWWVMVGTRWRSHSRSPSSLQTVLSKTGVTNTFFWSARIVVAVGRHCESDGPTQELPHSCLLVSLLHSFNFSEESKWDKITQTIKWKVRTKSPMWNGNFIPFWWVRVSWHLFWRTKKTQNSQCNDLNN